MRIALFDHGTAAKELDKHWEDLRQAREIILGMREHGGGNATVGLHILATLLTGKEATSRGEATRWVASYQACGKRQTPRLYDDEFLLPDPARHYGGAVVMLTSEKTYSATEDTVPYSASRQDHR